MRNLETEYKKSQQEETPDLWNRIEAGLSEKAPLKETETLPHIAEVPMKSAVAENPVTEIKKKVVSFTRFAKVAAAVLVPALLIPGAWILLQQGGSFTENAAMDMAANEQGMDTGFSDGVTADAATPEEKHPESLYEETANGATAEKQQDEAETEITTDCDSLANDIVTGATVDLEQITVTADMTVEEIRSEGTQTIYYLCTSDQEVYSAVFVMSLEDVEDEADNKESQNVTEALTYELKMGETYRFILQPAEGQEWDYEIKHVE